MIILTLGTHDHPHAWNMTTRLVLNPHSTLLSTLLDKPKPNPSQLSCGSVSRPMHDIDNMYMTVATHVFNPCATSGDTTCIPVTPPPQPCQHTDLLRLRSARSMICCSIGSGMCTPRRCRPSFNSSRLMVPVQQHKHVTEELSECLGKCPAANLVASHCTGWLSDSLAWPVKQLQPGC